MVISRSIHIAAPIDEVFALVTNPGKRAELNPTAELIVVEVEDGEPLHEGSRCHYRIRVGKRIIDYCTQIATFEPNCRVVTVTETEQPIEIEVSTTAEEDGTRLVQSEAFEPTEAMLQNVPEQGSEQPYVNDVLLLIDIDAALAHRRQQEQALQSMLENNLELWLEAIKRYLEERSHEVEAGIVPSPT